MIKYPLKSVLTPLFSSLINTFAYGRTSPLTESATNPLRIPRSCPFKSDTPIRLKNRIRMKKPDRKPFPPSMEISVEIFNKEFACFNEKYKSVKIKIQGKINRISRNLA